MESGEWNYGSLRSNTISHPERNGVKSKDRRILMRNAEFGMRNKGSLTREWKVELWIATLRIYYRHPERNGVESKDLIRICPAASH